VRALLRWPHDLVADDRGQDLVEYALLTAFFGLCALAAWGAIRDALSASYGATTAGVQTIWDPPPPSGGS
jgi:hypothetical protein